MKSEAEIKEIWRNTDAVCLDLDSTLCTDETYDELAKYLGVFDRVEALTRAGMNGNLSFKESFSETMNAINPTRREYEEFLLNRQIQVTPGAGELISDLIERRIDVYLVTGGFYENACLAADFVGIPRNNIFCNTIHFDRDGNYLYFTEEKLTNGFGKIGKSSVMEMLKTTRRYENLVMIGDGANDLEACPPADAFIGFGGNIIRENIKNQSEWFVTNFETLRKELPMKRL